jgi:hypothetical protein
MVIDLAVPRSEKERHTSHVLWMNRMEKLKNPGAFVTLAKELPDVRFIMCGAGPLCDQLARQA